MFLCQSDKNSGCYGKFSLTYNGKNGNWQFLLFHVGYYVPLTDVGWGHIGFGAEPVGIHVRFPVRTVSFPDVII